MTEGGWYKEMIAHLCQEYSYWQTNFVKRSKKCWAKSWLDQTPSTSPPFSESGISEWNIFANRYITEIEMNFANKLQMMYSYSMSCPSAIYAIGDVWFSKCLIMSVTLADCAAVFKIFHLNKWNNKFRWIEFAIVSCHPTANHKSYFLKTFPETIFVQYSMFCGYF